MPSYAAPMDSGAVYQGSGTTSAPVYQQQPVMQGRAIEASAREVAPVQEAIQQVSPLDGANRGPVVDPSAFILRGTRKVSHRN